jgi:D-serine deaminase-like pyridoxal phosphate-dependent protein
MTDATSLDALPTPALLLDQDVLERNIASMAARARSWGVGLRPHIKTHKCIEVGRLQAQAGAAGITVATLREARDFADHGFDDITWAFPVILSRLEEARALADRTTLRLVIDSTEALEALEATRHAFHVWLKVDCGYHRAGVDPGTTLAHDLARRLADSPRLRFDGILTHSGHAYHGPGRAEVAAAAREERDVMVEFAARLRAEGIAVPAVSVGSTPALSAIDHLEGVTEIRPGNYVFHDYTQVLLGACTPVDCALTVLTSVVSSQPTANHCVVDAGALALSKDAGRGDAPEPTMGELYEDYRSGRLRRDARLTALSQEHGHVRGTFRVGQRLRVLPNHSCLTAACFDEYHVVRGDSIVDRWKIWRGR